LWKRAFHTLCREIAGTEIEDKRFSLSLHYRHAQTPKVAREVLWRAAKLLKNCRVMDGKEVINLVPQGLPHKGDAMRRLVANHKATRAVFIGDDVTDEDVFRGAHSRTLCVRVGKRLSSHAKFYIPKQTDIDLLLDRWILARQ